MSLIQRNAVPLFILIAVIAVGVGVLMVNSPFAAGQEPLECDTSAVGISIITTDESGRPVSVVSHGDVISYTVNLSIPELPEGETACNFGGGTITITLPNGERIAVAGTAETVTIPTVSRGAVFTTSPVQYTINQNAGIQNASGNVELRARADYSGGTTFSAIEGEEAVTSQTKLVRMIPPSVVIDVAPAGAPGTDTQTVYQGQEAVFQITVTNTGGFELSNIAVSDSLAPDCDRAAGSLETLPVGASTAPYTCGVIPDASITNEAIVTATATATAAGAPVEIEVTNSDTTEVVFGEVEVGIVMEPAQQIARIGETASLDLTVSTPSVTALDDVTVTIVSVNGGASQNVTGCDSDLSIGRVEADADVPLISCSAVLPQGTNTVTATLVGTLPGTVEPLPEATATVFVVVIAPGLGISVTSGAELVDGVPTVRKGAAGPLTIVVSNNGDSSLSDVTVANLTGYPEAHQDCDRPLNLGQLAAGLSETIQCSSGILQEETTFIFAVSGIASDGNTEGAESTPVIIDILDSSTDVGLSADPATGAGTSVIRLVVQTTTITETNDGDSPLTDVRVTIDPSGVELNRNSKEYVRGDGNDDGILDPGETWEWRVVTIAVAGDVVLLPANALNLDLTATGYGIDELGGKVAFPGDAEEMETIQVPISAN